LQSETSEKNVRLAVRHIHLLAVQGAIQRDGNAANAANVLDGGGHNPNALGPGEVEEVPEAAEEPDADLVAAKAELVHLAARFVSPKRKRGSSARDARVNERGLALEGGEPLGGGPAKDVPEREVVLLRDGHGRLGGDVGRVRHLLLVARVRRRVRLLVKTRHVFCGCSVSARSRRASGGRTVILVSRCVQGRVVGVVSASTGDGPTPTPERVGAWL
jgi:hypothetical protein